MALGATQEMLKEARAAYIRLAMGGGIAEFKDQNGETVRYSRTDLKALADLIRMMEIELGLAPVLRPMKVWM